MLSFQQWRQLNENIGGAIPLGVANTQSVGVVNSNTWQIELDEAKKKLKKKKMLGDELEEKPAPKPDDEELDVDADTGDGEVVDKEEVPVKDKPKPDLGDEEGEGEGDELEKKPEEDVPMFQKKCSAGKKGCKGQKKLKKEETEDDFLRSIKSQMTFNPNQKNWDGISADFSEDALYKPYDPNSEWYGDDDQRYQTEEE